MSQATDITPKTERWLQSPDGQSPPVRLIQSAENEDVWYPDVRDIITDTEEPVDNMFSERQMRLLVEPLYAAWSGPGEGRTWVAMSNVGLFTSPFNPLVPDAMLSVDVEKPLDPDGRPVKAYFVWLWGKSPDVVIEVVSNRKGGEDTEKLAKYARMRVPFYLIHDPELLLSTEEVRVYQLQVDQNRYARTDKTWFPAVDLGLTIWQGHFEGFDLRWLRWCDANGEVIPTGQELALRERDDKEGLYLRANAERQRAERLEKEVAAERQKAERLAELLRAHGIKPE